MDTQTENVPRETNEEEKPEFGHPVCPHCGEDPVKIARVSVNFGPLSALALYCGNSKCRKLFNVVPMMIAQQQQNPLVVPGGRMPVDLPRRLKL